MFITDVDDGIWDGRSIGILRFSTKVYFGHKTMWGQVKQCVEEWTLDDDSELVLKRMSVVVKGMVSLPVENV